MPPDALLVILVMPSNSGEIFALDVPNALSASDGLISSNIDPESLNASLIAACP